MFKFLRRTICLLAVLAAAIGYLTVTRGGDPFRWFGTTTETALSGVGKRVKEYSDLAADQAERVHEGTKEVREGIEKLRQVPDVVTPLAERASPVNEPEKKTP